MTNEKHPELSKEELENAAGGFSASQKRGQDTPDKPLDVDELRRAAGGAQHQTRNKADGVKGVKGAQGDSYEEPPQGNMSGRTTLE